MDNHISKGFWLIAVYLQQYTFRVLRVMKAFLPICVYNLKGNCPFLLSKKDRRQPYVT